MAIIWEKHEEYNYVNYVWTEIYHIKIPWVNKSISSYIFCQERGWMTLGKSFNHAELTSINSLMSLFTQNDLLLRGSHLTKWP